MNIKQFTTLIAVFIVTIILISLISYRSVLNIVRTNLENIPMQIGDYAGQEDKFSDAVYEELNADLNIYRHYSSRHGNIIDLYIGYYGTAKGGRTPHNPHGCLPGSGWAILKTDEVKLFPSYYPNGVVVNYIISKKDTTFLSMLYWYQSDKTKVMATGIQQNLQRFVGRVLKNKNDGAFVRVTIYSSEHEIEYVKSYLTQFGDAIINILPEYWPEEN